MCGIGWGHCYSMRRTSLNRNEVVQIWRVMQTPACQTKHTPIKFPAWLAMAVRRLQNAKNADPGGAEGQDMKRFVDILIASTVLIAAAPVMLITAILVRWRLGSPVLFRQVRPGLGSKSFELVKFRTMRDARDSSGKLLGDHERLTTFGKALRATSLDELPQLFNVLKGDMSLVGPRPLLMEYLPHYSPEQARRHEVRPGITGWAQINGRNAISWEDKFRLDVWYVDNRGFWLDLKIMALTAMRIIRRNGVNAAANVTMPRFDEEKTSAATPLKAGQAQKPA